MVYENIHLNAIVAISRLIAMAKFILARNWTVDTMFKLKFSERVKVDFTVSNR